mmetsp:Transcript_56169/g.162755  ORF Transcript_56169/g.162755 Transcript_56169/m.162755 type:complete len:270 (-) Transcript_56169:218-1027(-)
MRVERSPMEVPSATMGLQPGLSALAPLLPQQLLDLSITDASNGLQHRLHGVGDVSPTARGEAGHIELRSRPRRRQGRHDRPDPSWWHPRAERRDDIGVGNAAPVHEVHRPSDFTLHELRYEWEEVLHDSDRRRHSLDVLEPRQLPDEATAVKVGARRVHHPQNKNIVEKSSHLFQLDPQCDICPWLGHIARIMLREAVSRARRVRLVKGAGPKQRAMQAPSMAHRRDGQLPGKVGVDSLDGMGVAPRDVRLPPLPRCTNNTKFRPVLVQ